MDRNELIAAIESGKLSTDLLSQIFDESMEIDEDLKLRALASMLKNEPTKIGQFFSRLNPDRLAQAIEHNKLDSSMISLAVRLFPDSEQLGEAALRQPHTPSPALLLLAERISGAALARLVRDETRLILSPELARALARNPNLETGQQSSLTTVIDKIEKDERLKIRQEYHPENFDTDDKELLLFEPVESSETEEPQKAEVRRESIYVKLQRMTPAEKALLAIHGNREVRMLLVRDSNLMVAKAAMRSPRLTEKDVSFIAQMRDVDEEILRIIANTRRHMRHYVIIKNLVMNPRTPIAIAIANIARLNNFDIRLSSRDHNIPGVVRQMAVKIARQRGLR